MTENDHLYGHFVPDDEPCVVCGRRGTLLLPYGDEGLACVECLAMEQGETKEVDDDGT